MLKWVSVQLRKQFSGPKLVQPVYFADNLILVVYRSNFSDSTGVGKIGNFPLIAEFQQFFVKYSLALITKRLNGCHIFRFISAKKRFYFQISAYRALFYGPGPPRLICACGTRLVVHVRVYNRLAYLFSATRAVLVLIHVNNRNLIVWRSFPSHRVNVQY